MLEVRERYRASLKTEIAFDATGRPRVKASAIARTGISFRASNLHRTLEKSKIVHTDNLELTIV